jgi:S1-C subfamily serine protease
MLKSLMAGLLAIVVLSSSAVASVPHKAITLAENVSVYITADIVREHLDPLDEARGEDEIKDRAICSGSVLASKGTEEIILTARHCTEGEVDQLGQKIDITPSHVHFFNGDVGTVQAIYRDETLDVALLKVHSMRSHKQHITLNNKGLVPGEKLFLYGMPNGMFWSYSEMESMNGDMEFSPAPPKFANLLQVSCASCYGGNSGGAVFNTKGQVVGILNAKGPNSMWVTSARRILNMLHNM